MALLTDPAPARASRILLVASEATPYAKTGGLADVAGALPRELARLGHDVRLVMPRYAMLSGREETKEWGRLSVPTWHGPVHVSVEMSRMPDPTLPPDRQARLYTVRYDPYFGRAGLYQEAGADYPDNLERFALFCRAVMELQAHFEASESWTADVLHAHDWQAALCVVYAKTLHAASIQRRGTASLFTVHNLGYQGIFPAPQFPRTGLPWSLFAPAALEFYGSCNLLKGGLVFADALSTVSETYSREIQTPELGFGLDGVIRERRDRLSGIVNGIDIEVWNPATDVHLPAHYHAEDPSGKRVCKAALQREYKLPTKNVPLLGIVSRLTPQKGLDLVLGILPELMALDLQLVLLGTGDPPLEARFREWRERFPNKIGVRIGFDEGLAHRIEGGADLFLMPSRYEPCGLNQMYSLRYGTVPIVRRTGGLADTVIPYSPLAIAEKRATGFLFGEISEHAFLTAILLAVRVYRDQEDWHTLMRAGMKTDVSWARSARSYLALYDKTRALAGRT